MTSVSGASVEEGEKGRRRGSVVRLAATTYLGTFLGLVTGPLVARALGPQGRGEYAAVMAYSAAFTLVLGLGFALSMNYALLKLQWSASSVYATALRYAGWLVVPSMLVAAGVFWVGALPRDANLALVILVALIPMGILQQCMNSLLLGLGDLSSFAAVRILPLVTSAAFVVVLFPLGLLTTASYLGVAVVCAVSTFLLTVRRLDLRPRDSRSPRELMGFSLRSFPGSLSNLANAQLDQMLVAPVLGTRDLGIYAIAVTVATVPLGLAQAISARSVRDNAAEAGGLDAERTEASLRLVLVTVSATSVALACAVPWLVPLLYGSDFAAVVPLVLVLLIGTVANGAYSVAAAALVISGRPGAQSMSQLVGLGVTAVGLAVTLPTIGVLGAAIVSALTYWVRLGWVLVVLRREGVRRVVPRISDFTRFGGLVADRFKLRRLGRLVGRRD